MASESILIIPDFIGRGKALREKLESMSWSNNRSSSTTIGTMSGNSNIKDVYLTLKLNDETARLYRHATSGEHIGYMKVEVNDVTAKTLKTAILYEFTDLMVNAFQISGSHDGKATPLIAATFNYATLKHSFFK